MITQRLKNFAPAIAILCCMYSCNTSTPVSNNNNDSTGAYLGFKTEVELGKHLVTIAGCGDCHTPKKMTAQGPVDDTTTLYSGSASDAHVPDVTKAPIGKFIAATFDQTAWVGPWGKSYAANITPDTSGIGNWSEAQFINCLRKGLYKGLDDSRPLMPPMPWQDYSRMSDIEIKAIFAYLKTVKPVRNIVPAYQPPVD